MNSVDSQFHFVHKQCDSIQFSDIVILPDAPNTHVAGCNQHIHMLQAPGPSGTGRLRRGWHDSGSGAQGPGGACGGPGAASCNTVAGRESADSVAQGPGGACGRPG